VPDFNVGQQTRNSANTLSETDRESIKRGGVRASSSGRRAAAVPRAFGGTRAQSCARVAGPHVSEGPQRGAGEKPNRQPKPKPQKGSQGAPRRQSTGSGATLETRSQARSPSTLPDRPNRPIRSGICPRHAPETPTRDASSRHPPTHPGPQPTPS